MQKYKDIEALSESELESQIEETRDRVRVVRFDIATKEVENTRLKRDSRRYLAQLLTEKTRRKS